MNSPAIRIPMSQTLGTLYLIPVPLAEVEHATCLPEYNASVIRPIRHFIVENVRSARRFLRAVDKSIDIDALTFYELNKHTDPSVLSTYLAPALSGEPMGVISEAGCPAVADPGADVVALAQRRGVRVVPLVHELYPHGAHGVGLQWAALCLLWLPADRRRRASACTPSYGAAYTHARRDADLHRDTLPQRPARRADRQGLFP